MKITKKLAAVLLLLAFVLVPLCSCAAQLKLPKEPKEEVYETKSYGQELRDSVETDPLFPDSPSEDEEFNVLLIGNSYSTHWTDELAFIFGAGGYENVNICNIYHSGAVFEEHWTWHVNGERVENFYINRPGQEKVAWEDVGFEECITYANWDVISFQQGNRLVGATGRYRVSISQWLPKIFTYLYERFPDAIYYWQQNWSHEAGGDSYTLEKTEKLAKWHREESLRVAKQWDFINTPLGSAWMEVRHDPLFYEGTGKREDKPVRSLTRRIQKAGENKGIIVDDLSHDGDVGGGSYLNGCVWYEMLTHKSVLDIEDVSPQYVEGNGTVHTLTLEQMNKLQEVAHQTVLADYGEEWYK